MMVIVMLISLLIITLPEGRPLRFAAVLLFIVHICKCPSSPGGHQLRDFSCWFVGCASKIYLDICPSLFLRFAVVSMSTILTRDTFILLSF